MSDHRITRNQAQSNEDLRKELDNYNPFQTKNLIPLDTPEGTGISKPSNESDKGTQTAEIEEESSKSDKSFSSESTVIPPTPEKGNRITVFDGETSVIRNTMASTPQVVQLKDALRVVPEFDGKNVPLSVFFEGCDEAKEMIGQNDEANLTKLIRSKLLGEIRTSIAGQSFTTIEALKDCLRAMYVPCRTVHQLQGELGNEYQREDESVITFANRIRELGKRLLDARRMENKSVTSEFRSEVEDNLIDCFKNGLLPDISIKLENAEDLTNIVKNAIRAEKILEGQRLLRGGRPRLEINNRREFKRVLTCRICHSNNHETEKCYQRTTVVICQLCGRNGHTAAQCRSNNTNQVTCQICKRLGHSAPQCRAITTPIICQFCKRAGHTADQCFLLRNKNTDQQNNFAPRNLGISCQKCNKPGHTASQCRMGNDNTAQFNSSSNPTTCNYCKRIGHTIKDCRKREYNEKMKISGNEQVLHGPSTAEENQKKETYSANQKLCDTLLFELIP